ncbi:MAG: rRNA maturation RNase YbeY [Bacteroidia bacterium]|nr:rRNA maturation RNase YbeY [Bacteroidia bacterium]
MAGMIEFLNEDTEFEIGNGEFVSQWIEQIILRHKHKLQEVSIIFCSDEYLLQMNKEHLNHDYYTDVITFPYGLPNSREISGDIFISVDRVKDNAAQRKIHPIDELHRVIIHGVLHLLGFDDKDEASEAEMRKEEDLALSLRMF